MNAAKVEANYNRSMLNAGDILTNAKGTRQIKLIRSFQRNTTRTTVPTVWVFSVLDANGQVDYNDQKTVEQLYRDFAVKVGA